MTQASPTLARLVIKETRQADLRSRAAVSVLGLLGVGAAVAVSMTLGLDFLADARTSAMIALAAVLLGMASLMAWRKSGEYEFVERVDDRIFIRTTKASQPVFDAPVSSVRFQKLVLPGGSAQLFLRDGVRAVELGPDMEPSDKEAFQAQMEELLGTPVVVR